MDANEITKSDFEAYEDVRKSGRTNMFMIRNVIALSGLDRDTIKGIMIHYNFLCKKFPEVRE